MEDIFDVSLLPDLAHFWSWAELETVPYLWIPFASAVIAMALTIRMVPSLAGRFVWETLHHPIQGSVKPSSDISLLPESSVDDKNARRCLQRFHGGEVWLTRVTLSASGAVVDQIEIPAVGAKREKDVAVLMIPGNPGVPGYYVPYLIELYTLLGRKVDVFCLSHTGHNAGANGSNLYTFSDNTEHKGEYIQLRLKENPNLKFLLAAHSIGAFMALNLSKRYPDAVISMVLMQPTLMEIGNTPNGRFFHPILRHHRQKVALLAALLSALPGAVKSLLGSYVVPSEYVPCTIEGLLDYQVVRNFTLMALGEMEELLAIDSEAMDLSAEKMLILFAEKDGWVPLNPHAEYITSTFPKVRFQISPEWDHAFMMKKSGASAMAKISCWWMTQALAKLG